MSERVTSRRYESPHRPAPIVAVERWLRRVRGEPAPFDARELVKTAMAKAGSSSFEEEDALMEPLERLCEALDREARLTWTGRVLTRARLMGALTSRLRLRALFDANPAMADVVVDRPVVITGLQRTGTTLLHRLVSATPGFRGLRAWEALDPVAAVRPFGLEPRRLTAKAAEGTLRYLAPDFFAVHPVEADAPEEEVVLMDHTFVSQVSEASYHVPTFAGWVEDQDHRVAYRYLRRCLQALTWQRPELPARWVLKSPVHLEQLDALLDVFPDALVVQTHRDPQETIPSFCSMVAHGRGVFSDAVDPREVGGHWLRKVTRMVRRAMETRRARGGQHFADVHYGDLIADPVATAAEVTARAGTPLDDASRASLRTWLADNRQHKYGRHDYDAADFGLTPERIDHAMSAYVSHHLEPRASSGTGATPGARGAC